MEALELLRRAPGLALYYVFSTGVLALPQAALVLLLNRELHLPPERVTAYYGALFATQLLKPAWGLASDSLPFLHRRGVIVPSCALIAFATWRLAAVSDERELLLFGLASSAAYSAAEAAADGALLEAAPNEASLAALQVAAATLRTVSSAAATLCGALLLRALPPRHVLRVAASLAVFATVSSCFVADVRRAPPSPSPRRPPADPTSFSTGRARAVLRVLRRSAPPAVLLLLLSSAPRADDALASFVSTAVSPPLAPAVFGWAAASAEAGALAGTLLYGRLLARSARRDAATGGAPPSQRDASTGGASPSLGTLRGCTFAGASLSLLRVAIPFAATPPLSPSSSLLAALVIFISAVTSVGSRLALMPQIVLCASLAPPGGEAASFAALTTLLSAGGLLSALLSSLGVAALRIGCPPKRSWAPLTPWVVVDAACHVAPLALLPWVRGRGAPAGGGRAQHAVEGAAGDGGLCEPLIPLLDGSTDDVEVDGAT